MKYWTRDREAGNKIDCFDTLEEAQAAITEYEEADKKDGSYSADFYEIYVEGVKYAKIEDCVDEDVQFYETLEEANKEAERNWKRLTDAEKCKFYIYVTDVDAKDCEQDGAGGVDWYSFMMSGYTKKYTFDSKRNDAIASYMDDEIREDLHQELAPCSFEEFLNAYVKRDEKFKEILTNEFSIDI